LSLIATTLSTNEIMADVAKLKRVRNLLAASAATPELVDFINFYLLKISASLTTIATQNSDVADYVDVLPWLDFV